MKRIFVLFILALTIQNANARIIIYETIRCNPGTDNNFDWVSGVSTQSSSEPLYWKGEMVTNVRIVTKTISCDDPGATPCVFPGYTSPDIDYNEASEQIAEQIALGNNSGHIYANGSSGSLTPSTLFNGTEVLGACFMWEVSSPTCNRAFIIIEEED